MAASTRRVVIPLQDNGMQASPRRAASPLDDLADHGTEGVNVSLLGRMPERETQRAASPGVVGAHRQQHMTWLSDAGGARRARRAGDAASVEQHQQGIALAAREGKMRVAWQPARPRRRAVEHRVRYRRKYLA